MYDFATFVADLRNALNQLYEPVFHPPSAFKAALGGPYAADTGIKPVILAAIESFRPDENEPPDTRRRRVFDVLTCRYVQGMTQEEAALQLGFTPRHLRREQASAIEALGQQLWEARTDLPAEASSLEKLTQLRQDVTALHRHDPAAVTELDKLLEHVVGLVSTLAGQRGVEAVLRDVTPGLVIPVPAAQLGPLLIRLLTDVVRSVAPSGVVALEAEERHDGVMLTLSASPVSASQPPEDDLVEELLKVSGVHLTVHQSRDGMTVGLLFPNETAIRIAVVEDNPDVLHTYQRYIRESRYTIVPVENLAQPISEIEMLAPDLVLLDIMLPEIDGWELLSRLRAHPTLHSVPIIICSVLEEEELALALGASRCLSKPVRYDQFITALDELLL